MSYDVVRIAAGDHHTCVVMSSCSVKCWGLGTSGLLGSSLSQTRAAMADTKDWPFGARAGIYNGGTLLLNDASLAFGSALQASTR